MSIQVNGDNFTGLQLAFVDEYMCDFNATRSAQRAGYSGNENVLANVGHNLLRLPKIAKLVKKRLEERVMTVSEIVMRLADQGRFDMTKYMVIDHESSKLYFDVEALRDDGLGSMVKEVVIQRSGAISYKFHDGQKALEILARHHGLLVDVLVSVSDDVTSEDDLEKRKKRILDLLNAARARGIGHGK